MQKWRSLYWPAWLLSWWLLWVLAFWLSWPQEYAPEQDWPRASSTTTDRKETDDMLNVSPVGLQIITRFESLKLEAYQDSKGVWTIGFGHTGPEAKKGNTITEERAWELLGEDVETAEKAIDRNVRVALNQNQYDALTSFIFNVGSGNFQTSKLLRKLNAEDYEGAADQFRSWRRSGGKILNGLIRRRAAEEQLFVTPPQQTFNISQPVPVEVLVQKAVVADITNADGERVDPTSLGIKVNLNLHPDFHGSTAQVLAPMTALYVPSKPDIKVASNMPDDGPRLVKS